MPIVTTLHTILGEPNALQRHAMDELTRLSERLVVMTAHGAAVLRDVHGVPNRKIDVIPHGIPSVPFTSRGKDQLGVEGKSVLLTFGLLSPDKGIEYVIDALPAVLARYPDTVYIVLGATHPHVKERYGETYRLSLEHRAQRLGVDSSVIFHNRFASQAELTEFLAAADIYVTPSLNPEQSTSGTLAYAVGAGKAVISTPYLYARELLADGRGTLVPWRGPAGDRARGRGPAWRRCEAPGHPRARRRLWSQHALARGGTLLRAELRACARRAHRAAPDGLPSEDAREVAGRAAEVNLEHLCLMADQTGMLQHTAFSIPRYDDGYRFPCATGRAARPRPIRWPAQPCGTADSHRMTVRRYRQGRDRERARRFKHDSRMYQSSELCGRDGATGSRSRESRTQMVPSSLWQQ